MWREHFISACIEYRKYDCTIKKQHIIQNLLDDQSSKNLINQSKNDKSYRND
jgi:hypothetical protein